MKLKRFNDFKEIQESMSDDPNTEYVDIEGEYSKLKQKKSYGVIDLGKEHQVSTITIENLKKTHPDALIFYKDSRVMMKLKDNNEEETLQKKKK